MWWVRGSKLGPLAASAAARSEATVSGRSGAPGNFIVRGHYLSASRGPPDSLLPSELRRPSISYTPLGMIDAQVVQNVRNALRELQEERSLIERKIAALNELLATAPVKKRGPGRPRKAAAAAAPRAAKKAAPKAAAKAAAAAPAPAAKAGKKPAAPKAAVAAPAAKKTRRKAKWSPAARKAARDRMKKYWAARKKKK